MTGKGKVARVVAGTGMMAPVPVIPGPGTYSGWVPEPGNPFPGVETGFEWGYKGPG